MAQLSKTYDIPAEVLFSSTELLDPVDLNHAQNLLLRNISAVLEAAMSDGDQLRCFKDALRVTASGSTLVLTISGGEPLLWKLSADPGTPAPQVLIHLMGADDTFTADTADATNPRIDVFSAKVEADNSGGAETRVYKDASGNISSQSFNKRQRTRLTITYTPGTPAASPAAPAAPAGEVVFAQVLVAATATALDQEDVSDLRSVFNTDQPEEVTLLDDFMVPLGQLAWTDEAGNGGDVPVAEASTDLHHGITRFGVDNVDEVSGISMRGLVLGKSAIEIQALIRIPVLPAVAAENYRIMFGLGEAAASFDTGTFDCIRMQVEQGDTDWQLYTNDGSDSQTDSGKAATTDWTLLKITYDPVAAQAEFFVNGVSIGTKSTNIPTVELKYFVAINTAVATASKRFLDLDWFRADVKFTEPRR